MMNFASPKKVVFTGGHHNSALVLARAMRQKGWQVYWFGHKHTMAGEKSVSLEFKEITKAGFPFIELKTGKFYKNLGPLNLLKIGYGFFQALVQLIKIKPRLIFSFGGYLSVPVVLAGLLLRKDCFLQEQTARAGLANRFLGPLVKKIFLVWPSSKEFFPARKTEVVGLPLDPLFWKKTEPSSLFREDLPTILITGGKQGCQVINQAVEARLPELLKKVNLIHQSGGILKTGDYQRLEAERRGLKGDLRRRYLLKKSFYGQEMINMLKAADLVVGRSGAHMIYELLALAKPALLIPLPWAYQQEQLANARILEKAGSALILPQAKLSGAELSQKINFMLSHLEGFKKKARLAKKLVSKKATEEILKNLEKALQE